MKNKSNLTYLADRLQTGKWLISPAAYEALAKQVDAKLNADNGIINRFMSATSALFRNASMPDNDVGPTEMEESDPNSEYVAVIPVHGVLIKGVSEDEEMEYGLCNPDRISEALDQAIDDPTVSAVCLDFATPGGETLGIETLARKISRLSEVKPIYGWSESQSASAGWWLMSQCTSITITPDAQLGSVGVYCMLEDYSEYLKKEGIKVEAIFAGKFKMLGHGFKPLTDEERAILKADIDHTYIKFKSAVTSKRNIKDEDLQGLMYEGTNAIQVGYADFTSDSFTDYLNSKETYMKNFTKVAVAKAAVKGALPETIPSTIKAEEPKEEPKHDEKHEEAKAEETEEMKHVEMGDDNIVACPHCSKHFAITEPEPEKEEAKAEEPKEEPKAEDTQEDKEKHGTKFDTTGKTMAELMGLAPARKQDALKVAFDNAILERTGFGK